jgi:hypothetical protein
MATLSNNRPGGYDERSRRATPERLPGPKPLEACPSGSALEWSDLAAMYPGLPPQALENLGYNVLRTAVPG